MPPKGTPSRNPLLDAPDQNIEEMNRKMDKPYGDDVQAALKELGFTQLGYETQRLPTSSAVAAAFKTGIQTALKTCKNEGPQLDAMRRTLSMARDTLQLAIECGVNPYKNVQASLSAQTYAPNPVTLDTTQDEERIRSALDAYEAYKVSAASAQAARVSSVPRKPFESYSGAAWRPTVSVTVEKEFTPPAVRVTRQTSAPITTPRHSAPQAPAPVASDLPDAMRMTLFTGGRSQYPPTWENSEALLASRILSEMDRMGRILMTTIEGRAVLGMLGDIRSFSALNAAHRMMRSEYNNMFHPEVVAPAPVSSRTRGRDILLDSDDDDDDAVKRARY